MAKIPYSIVLSEEIVAGVDRLAASRGMSRSAMVNAILAEYISLPTPEQQRVDVLALVQRTLSASGLRATTSAGGTLTLRTALQYKYNPALSYAVELSEKDETVGELRVVLRSQNQTLLAYMRLFFQLWVGMEQKHLQAPPPEGWYTLNQRRYTRMLRKPPEGKSLGDALAGYIGLMDECMKTYFDNLEDAGYAVAATESRYLKGLAALGGLQL